MAITIVYIFFFLLKLLTPSFSYFLDFVDFVDLIDFVSSSSSSCFSSLGFLLLFRSSRLLGASDGLRDLPLDSGFRELERS